MAIGGFDSYVICTSPRSGSTLLCALLAETGVAGYPGSHFHQPSLARWLEVYQLTTVDFSSERDALHAVFLAARQRGTGQNGIFGLRMQRGSFDYFISQTGFRYPKETNDVARIEAAFGKTLFIHLSRKDKLAQAISRVKAEQTGLWHRNSDGSERERLSPPQEPRYDPEAIAHHMAELARFDEEWEQWFVKEGIQPLRIDYDRLSQQPQNTVAELLSALGMDPKHAKDITAPTAKLADSTNSDWVRRFQSESSSV